MNLLNGFEKRTAEKKAQVKKAAFQLMNTPKGANGLTMAAVAKLSATSKATIFKYFESKEKLIQQVFLDYLQHIKLQASDLLTVPLPFEEKLLKITQIKMDNLAQVDEQFFQDLMGYYSKKDDPDFAKAMASYTQHSYDLMLDLFHQGRKEGKVDLKYSDEFLMLYMESMIQGITRLEIYQKIKVSYTQNWTEMLLKSLAPTSKQKE